MFFVLIVVVIPIERLLHLKEVSAVCFFVVIGGLLNWSCGY